MNRICLFILALLALFNVARAQQPDICVLDKTAPPRNSWHWEPDTTIKLYFQQNMFTPEQREALFETIKAWNIAAHDAGTGIKIIYAGETIKPLVCEQCLTVAHGEIRKYDKKHYAFFYPVKRNSAGLVLSSWIIFDNGITKPKALQGFMAHELGHGMGLWDCQTCKKKKTIMNSFPGVNEDNGLLAPSTCDRQVVKKIYEQYRTLVDDSGKQPSQGLPINLETGAINPTSQTGELER